MPISCRDCKARLSTSPSHVRSAIASIELDLFTFRLLGVAGFEKIGDQQVGEVEPAGRATELDTELGAAPGRQQQQQQVPEQQLDS